MIQTKPISSKPQSNKLEAVDYHYSAHSPIDRILQKISEMEVPGREHFESYMRHKWRMNHKPSTLKGSFQAVSFFLTFYAGLGKRQLQNIVSDDLEAFIEHEQDRGIKVTTARTQLKHLWAFIRFLIQQDIIDERILKRKIKLKVPDFLPRAIAPCDIRRLLGALKETRDRALILVLLRTGMRIGELLRKNLSMVSAAMESTGCYHTNLLCFLATEGIPCFVINPLLIANFAKLSLRKTKTDKKDAKVIAQFLLVHKDALVKARPSQSLQDLKDLARERESLTVLMSGLKNDIKRMLQITFPELESLCNVFSESMRDIIKQFPSARLIRTADVRAIKKALTPSDARRTPPFYPEDFIKAAQTSVATDSIAKELILPEKYTTLEHLMKQRERITNALVEACQAMMIKDLEIITSIGGISDMTASTFLAEVGDYKAFPSYKHLIAFAGLDPSIHQSGKFEGPSKISKRGNRHLRHIIYIMTSCVVRQDNVFRVYYLRRRAEGLPFKKAILATAHKLIRVIFSMLLNRTAYEKKVVMHNS